MLLGKYLGIKGILLQRRFIQNFLYKLTKFAFLAIVLIMVTAKADNLVCVYSEREINSVAPVLNAFEKKTGIEVLVQFFDKGLNRNLVLEGEKSFADVLIVENSVTLDTLIDEKMLRQVDSETIKKNIPKYYRDSRNKWFGLTISPQAIYVSKRNLQAMVVLNNYEDLVDPNLKNKICFLKGLHASNISLFSWMIDKHGSQWFENWIVRLRGNLTGAQQESDLAQFRAIYTGVCDIVLAGSHHYGMMLENTDNPIQKKWAESLYVVAPNQKTTGAHVNVSVMAMARYTRNSKNALKLMEYLSTDEALALLAKTTHTESVNREKKGRVNVPVLDIVYKVDSSNIEKTVFLSKTTRQIIRQTEIWTADN